MCNDLSHLDQYATEDIVGSEDDEFAARQSLASHES